MTLESAASSHFLPMYQNGKVPETMELSEVRSGLLGFECVCIDVDSTACVDEGIDVLAEAAGCGEEVANW